MRDWTRLVLAVTAIVGLTVIIVTYLQTSQGRRISRFDDGDDSLLHDVDRRRQRDQLLESIESSAFAIEVDDGSVQRSLGAGSRAVSPNVVVGTAAMAQRIAVALESRTRRISACFEQNPSSDLITSDVILEVTVDTDGVAHEVRVLPSALEETRLGRCLISVTHSTSFPHQDLPIRVRVPLVVSGVR